MPFIKLNSPRGEEILINIDHVVRVIGKDDSYQIDMTNEYSIPDISKAEYDSLKYELGINDHFFPTEAV